jgi:heat shock protein HspQ
MITTGGGDVIRVTMQVFRAKFTVGQLIIHKLFNYRGVIVDVDPDYKGTEEWYQQVALTRPPRDKPWYRVLVHNASYETYVAERNLDLDDSQSPVNNPMLTEYFDDFVEGRYIMHHREN